MIEIIQIPLLSDNYSYIIVDTNTNITACIDPSVAKDIDNVLQDRGCLLYTSPSPRDDL